MFCILLSMCEILLIHLYKLFKKVFILFIFLNLFFLLFLNSEYSLVKGLGFIYNI